MQRSLLLFFFLCTTYSQLAAYEIATVRVAFYSESLSMRYDRGMMIELPDRLREKEMIEFFRSLEKTGFQILLDDLLTNKSRLGLNDWLFYQLMDSTLADIYPEAPASQIVLYTWFLLSKAGFDTRLTYLNDKLFVYVYTRDEIFEVPLIEENGRVYANLTSIGYKNKSTEALYMLNFQANRNGRAFDFFLTSLPRLKPEPRAGHFEFTYANQRYQLQVETDDAIVEMMKNYPLIAEKEYLKVPFSHTIASSLIPQLTKFTAGLTKQQTLELLASFTRSSFPYKEDKAHFGRSKPMIPDEVFHYPFSDCEDRVALFVALVKNLLDLPMIVIAFPDHLTVGVALEGIQGPAIRYQGRQYFICDPTGPVDSTSIGSFPNGYENSPFEIIYSYK